MASPVDTSAKFFNENLPDAPVLNGVAGSLIGLLTACLVTGFGLRIAVSLVVSGGVATLTLANEAKNANRLHTVVLVEGVTGALTALNGEQKITFASPPELKFATAAADGTATGAITVKTAPAGWEKKFPGTNTAAFKSLDPTSRGRHLWVNDSTTLDAKVRGFENMSDVDTGTGPFPTLVELASGGFWSKSSAANAVANRWDLFADSWLCYYCPVSYSGAAPLASGQGGYWFGDVLPFKSGDAFATSLSAATAAPGSGAANASVFVSSQGASTTTFPRSYSGLGSAVSAFAVASAGSGTSGLDLTMGVFPTATDGGLRLTKIHAMEAAAIGASAILRGEMPGVLHSPQTELYKSFQRGDTVVFGGRTYYVVQCGGGYVETPGSAAGRGFVDITGPWR